MLIRYEKLYELGQILQNLDRAGGDADRNFGIDSHSLGPSGLQLFAPSSHLQSFLLPPALNR
jgi:hypothetical protein